MSRAAQVAIALFVAWLVVYLLLRANPSADTDLVNLFGLLPIWAPLLAIAALGAAVWVRHRLHRR